MTVKGLTSFYNRKDAEERPFCNFSRKAILAVFWATGDKSLSQCGVTSQFISDIYSKTGIIKSCVSRCKELIIINSENLCSHGSYDQWTVIVRLFSLNNNQSNIATSATKSKLDALMYNDLKRATSKNHIA